ncbi:unnamed protein product [Adineta steineri]|uniref:Uncharacterized protein n=1 Tax=Adineta steineri TaxID=433720 RepID=A0A814M544_9BILA|nr:unnamed protein product [Adineta steineri]CAF4081884.1 unnamed protein product [Adineta steineri]
MASARNLCQHSDIDGTQCTSNDYVLCPHCQLQVCLKHLNFHQDQLRSDLFHLFDNINHVRINLDNLIFDPTNYRAELFEKLDNWYNERSNLLNKIYSDKKQQLQILCLQAHMEFDTYKTKKDLQLKDNLLKQFKKVSKQKQIHIDDINDMKNKLNDIETGLDELKQLLIDIYPDTTNMDIHIVKRRYVEATRPSFNIDDDDNLWDIEDDDDDDDDEKMQSSDDIQIIGEFSNTDQYPSSPDIILLPSPKSSSIPMTPCSSKTTTISKKEPLKFIIKRLQHSTTPNQVKYKLHTVPTSSVVLT